MKRFARILLDAATAVSLVLCVAAVALWVRSYGSPGVDLTYRWLGSRYALRSDAGRLVVLGTPVVPAAKRAECESFVAGIDDAEISWVVWIDRTGRPVAANATVVNYDGGPAPEVDWALIRALDDPARWVGAHMLLADRLTYRRLACAIDVRPRAAAGGPVVVTWDGLEAELSEKADDFSAIAEADPERGVGHWYWAGQGGRRVRVDPGQCARVRLKWYGRYGVPVASVGFAWLAAATAIPPVLAGVTLVRRSRARRARRALGQCPACDYDLRATPGRCPECGTIPAP